MRSVFFCSLALSLLALQVYAQCNDRVCCHQENGDDNANVDNQYYYLWVPCDTTIECNVKRGTHNPPGQAYPDADNDLDDNYGGDDDDLTPQHWPYYTGWAWEINGCHLSSAIGCAGGTIGNAPGGWCNEDDGPDDGINDDDTQDDGNIFTDDDDDNDNDDNGFGANAPVYNFEDGYGFSNNGGLNFQDTITARCTTPYQAGVNYIGDDRDRNFPTDAPFDAPLIPQPVGNTPNLRGTGSRDHSRRWFGRTFCGPLGGPTTAAQILQQVQTIHVVDSTPPDMRIPDNMNHECDSRGVAIYPNTFWNHLYGTPRASDTCEVDDSTIIFSQSILRGGSNCVGANNVHSRTITATDSCGNSATQTQTITIVDTTPPFFSAVDDEIVQCEFAQLNDATVPFTVDDCFGTTLTNTQVDQEIIRGKCRGDYIEENYWQSVDGCGNIAYGRTTRTVVDTTPPAVSPDPSNRDEIQFVQCSSNIVAPQTYTALDQCSEPSVVAVDIQEIGIAESAHEYDVVRTYTVSDACGNSVSFREVTVVDETPIFDLGDVAIAPSEPPVVNVAKGTTFTVDYAINAEVTDCISDELTLTVYYDGATVITLPTECQATGTGPAVCQLNPVANLGVVTYTFQFNFPTSFQANHGLIRGVYGNANLGSNGDEAYQTFTTVNLS